MAYMFYQNLTKADNSSPALLPYNRVSSGFEASYGFDNRYLVKFDLGYSGSEQYARNVRYTSTPAVSVAWLLSNEGFLKNNTFVTNLKLRASYGKTANDQRGLGPVRLPGQRDGEGRGADRVAAISGRRGPGEEPWYPCGGVEKTELRA